MFKEQSYIYKKEIDWSVLREGFSIPVSIQMIFKERIKNYLKRGEKRDLKVIVEAHHIVFFVSSLNNDASNIIVLCPNHHRIIHKASPIFEREKYSFVYPNGIEEKLILNNHLQSTA